MFAIFVEDRVIHTRTRDTRELFRALDFQAACRPPPTWKADERVRLREDETA